MNAAGRKRRVARNFSRAAASYDSLAHLQQQMAVELVELCRLPRDSTGTMADLGCGTGTGTQLLRRRLPAVRLVACDLAPAMLRPPCWRGGAAAILQCDMERLPLADACLDLAYSNAALQWCHAPCAMAQMARCLRPGGEMLVATFCAGTLRQWRQIFADAGLGDPRIALPDVDSLTRMAKDCGMGDISVRQRTVHQHFDDGRAMLDSVRRMGAANPAAQRMRRGDYRALHLALERCAAAGPIMASWEILWMRAVRML